MKKTLVAALLSLACGLASTALLAQSIDALRTAPIPTEAQAPAIAPLKNTSERQVRNYPEQPPLIPHSIEGYEIDLNSNKCLSCHARARTGESQAPMLSITHFMDRDGQFLASVSPRRFFCTQCHVPQHDTKAPVDNDFVDVDTMLSRSQPGGRR